jgi:hypothetical protein
MAGAASSVSRRARASACSGPQAEDVGKWVVDDQGVGSCIKASVNLERTIPGYKASPERTKSFRLAIRAYTKNEINTWLYRSFSLATVHEPLPLPRDLLANLEDYRGALNLMSAGQIHYTIQAQWELGNSTAGQVMCRQTQLDKALHGYTRKALIKAGATASSVDARINALNALYNAYCEPGGSAAQTAMRSYLRETNDVFTEISATLSPLLGGALDRDMLAANVMAQVMLQGLGTIAANCGFESRTLLAFLESGALPPGKDATNVLFGTCSGSATQVADGRGFGGDFAGETRSRSAARCSA